MDSIKIRREWFDDDPDDIPEIFEPVFRTRLYGEVFNKKDWRLIHIRREVQDTLRAVGYPFSPSDYAFLVVRETEDGQLLDVLAGACITPLLTHPLDILLQEGQI